MKRLLLVFISTACMAYSQANPQQILIALGSKYSGPGDVVSGAMAWWGLRAYSNAKAGTKAANICNASDTNCADVNTLTNGNFDVATSQGAPLNCGGAGGTCTVKTLYDQSGSTLCIGSTACNLTNTTIANRPTLTFNCVGALPCMTWASPTVQVLSSLGLIATQSQPFSVSAVGERTGAFTSIGDIAGGASNGFQFGFGGSANTALLYAGTITTATAADSTLHALQGLANGASSVISVDGSPTNVSAGANTLFSGSVLTMGKNNNGLTGLVMEQGLWGSSISSSFSALSINQHAYWGF